MLRTFVQSNREELLSRTLAKLSARPSPPASTVELEHGVACFLAQLPETLRLETSAGPFPAAGMCADAADHGRELLAGGCAISQGVHDYADACEAIAELAIERGTSISAEEQRSLNRCGDAAIAQAVTEYERVQEEACARQVARCRRQLAHDLRNLVHTALLSFGVLEAGSADTRGRSAAILGRTLGRIRDLAEAILAGSQVIPEPKPRPAVRPTPAQDRAAPAAPRGASEHLEA